MKKIWTIDRGYFEDIIYCATSAAAHQSVAKLYPNFKIEINTGDYIKYSSKGNFNTKYIYVRCHDVVE